MKALGRAVLAAALVSGCAKAKAPPLPEVPVRVGQVSRMRVPVTVETVGAIEAYNCVTVLSRVSGEILERHFREGQAVAAGDLLFSIDPGPFRQKLKDAESQLVKDEVLFKYNKAEAGRFAYLFEHGVASRSDFEKNQSASAALEQMVESGRAAVEQARLNLSYCEIRSPISGRAGNYLANKGAVVDAYKTPLVVVNQTHPAKVAFSVPEKHLLDLKKLIASAAPAVSVSVPETTLQRDGGKISFLDNSVDKTSGMIRLKAEFPNQDAALWPGQFVRVVLLLETLPDALVAPTEAVQTNPQGAYVFVVAPDRTAQLRTVVVSQTCGLLSVISRGLRPGETVVTDGQNKLKHGRKVKAVAAEASAGKAGS
ncbi:MAG: efflux RND transporter periplasmic adaptor subunit [Elusimicrobia bacterium]|nr:efflux RND transporter periplasmic adaptor subunit [Elusimicrobiota bacterium]